MVDHEERDIEKIRRKAIDATTIQRLIDARRGQGRFRDDLLQRFQNRCAVTTCRFPLMLRASHCKPWAEGSDEERLDPNNGLLLEIGIDRLFDANLIGFDRSGAVVVSSRLPRDEQERLQVNRLSLRQAPTDEQWKYLAEHLALVRRG